MTMDSMVKYLENRGFDVVKERDTANNCYVFTISKDDITYEAPFVYPTTNDWRVKDELQRIFLNGLIEDFSKAKFHKAKNAYYEILCEKFRKETDYTTMFNPNRKFAIKDVIFNPPATIVFWEDGTKTVVKAGENDIFDAEKGLAMAITKKALGNQGNYYNEIRKWVEPYGLDTVNCKFDLSDAIVRQIDIAKSLLGIKESDSSCQE